LDYIPAPTSLRRATAYGAAGGVVALFLESVFLPLGTLLDGVILATIIGLFAYLILSYRRLRMYGFDATGVYRNGRLFLPWAQVKRLSLSFRNRSGSVTLVARPTWASLVSGGPFENATFVAYGVALAFELENGGRVSIPSNLDRLAGNVMERIDEFAKSANPGIELV
jgi:hypothetical protein